MITLEVLQTGPLALIQDLGRPGLADVGVTRSGAADRRSHRLANRLVANRADSATIEITLGGFAARVHGGDVDVAVTGADKDAICKDVADWLSRATVCAPYAYPSLTLPQGALLAQTAPKDGVVATIDGKPITEKDLERAVRAVHLAYGLERKPSA